MSLGGVSRALKRGPGVGRVGEDRVVAMDGSRWLRLGLRLFEVSLGEDAAGDLPGLQIHHNECVEGIIGGGGGGRSKGNFLFERLDSLSLCKGPN